MNFIIFMLSKFGTKLLAANHLIIWDRTKFYTEQKSSKFLLEIMTLVSSANNIGSHTEYILRGRSFIYIIDNWGPRLDFMFQCTPAREKKKGLNFMLTIPKCWIIQVLKLYQSNTTVTQTTFALVRSTCGKKWGLRPNMVHCLYTRVIRPSILYGALVWWPKVIQKTTKTQLGRIQRMACLAITGAMKSTPTAAMEVLLNLTPLNLLIMAEARMALYRLLMLKQRTSANNGPV